MGERIMTDIERLKQRRECVVLLRRALESTVGRLVFIALAVTVFSLGVQRSCALHAPSPSPSKHNVSALAVGPATGCTSTFGDGGVELAYECHRCTEPVGIAADASVLLTPYGAPMKTIPNGSTASIFAVTQFTTENTACDGGQPCDCATYRKTSCRFNDGGCLRTDSTPANQIFTDIDNGSICGLACSSVITVTDAGIPYSLATCNVPAQVNTCMDIYDTNWSFGPPPPVIPAIVAMGPNAGPAGGGLPLSGTCTNCATGNTLTIGGTQTAPITVTGAGPTFAWTATLPAWTSTSGSASLQTLTISSAAGSTAFAEGFYYYPSICRFLELYDDPRIAASVNGSGCVTVVPDDSGNNLTVTINSTNSTCLGFLGDGSGIGTGGALNFGTGGPYLTVSNFGSYSQPVTFMAAIQAQSVAATPTVLASNNAGADVSLALNSSGELQVFAGSGPAVATGMSSIFGSPEVVGAEVNGSSSLLYLGSTSQTLSPTSPGGNSLQNLTIGNSAAHSTSNEFLGRIGDICIAPIGAISSGYYNSPGAILAILENRYGLIPPPPTISTFGPGIGPASGGITLTGTGTNLVNGATLNLGIVSTTISATNCTAGLCTNFTATSPAWTTLSGTATPQAITITTTGGTSPPYTGGNNGQGFQFVPSRTACPLKMLLLADDPRVTQSSGTLLTAYDDSGNNFTVTPSGGGAPAGWKAAGSGIGNLPSFYGENGANIVVATSAIAQPFTFAATIAPVASVSTCHATSNNVLFAAQPDVAQLAIATTACTAGFLNIYGGTAIGCATSQTPSSLCSTSATFVNQVGGVFNGSSSFTIVNTTQSAISPTGIGTTGIGSTGVQLFTEQATASVAYWGQQADQAIWACDAVTGGDYAVWQAIEASRY
jgi:hypothetical protein